MDFLISWINEKDGEKQSAFNVQKPVRNIYNRAEDQHESRGTQDRAEIRGAFKIASALSFITVPKSTLGGTE